MDILLKSVQIVDPNSPFHLQIKSVRLANGRLVKIADTIAASDKDQIIDATGNCLCPSFVDVGAVLKDPGSEIIESIDEFSQAAHFGGYGHVLCIPETHPAVDNGALIKHIINSNKNPVIQIHPLGQIAKSSDKTSLAEILDMKEAGAAGYTNGLKNSGNIHLTFLAFQYVKAFEGTLFLWPFEHALAMDGQMNEGRQSAHLGLKAIPKISEHIALYRDLELLRKTNSKLHALFISTAESVELIRRAKSDKLSISCCVPILNIIATDSAIENFDPNYKVFPPLGTADNRTALIQALSDGTIDMVSSHHQAVAIEGKDLEFPYAEGGVIGLQTTYALLNRIFDTPQIVDILSIRTRKSFDLPEVVIKENELADYVLIDPLDKWIMDEKAFFGRYSNTPYLGEQLMGKVKGIINEKGFSPVHTEK